MAEFQDPLPAEPLPASGRVRHTGPAERTRTCQADRARPPRPADPDRASHDLADGPAPSHAACRAHRARHTRPTGRTRPVKTRRPDGPRHTRPAGRTGPVTWRLPGPSRPTTRTAASS